MFTKNLKVGDRIEISLMSDTSRTKVYLSQIESIIDGERLVILAPISEGRIVPLSKNDDYSFVFFSDKGMLRYSAIIEDIFKEDGFTFMNAALGADGEKVQRREFFRFSCLLPIKFAVVSDSSSSGGSNELSDGIIKDVGGGGVRFVSNTVVEENSKIKCLLLLDNDYLIIIGKVLHRQYFPKSVYKYQYRAMFIGILPEEQERIVHFIFNQQRKNLRRIDR